MKKKILGILVCMLLIASIIPISLAGETPKGSITTTASDLMQPSGTVSKPITINNQATFASMYEKLTRGNYPAPDFNFSKLPTTLLHSWYDYQISNYNSYAIQRQTQNGNGEYVIFHAKPTSTSIRKVYYAYVNSTLGIQNMGQVKPSETIQSGFPGMAIHPTTGDPIVTWHGNYAGNGRLETEITYDNFDGTDTPNHWQNPLMINDNNPDSFIWPNMYVGPSPWTGNIRIYQIAENNQTTPGTPTFPCENVRLYYADVPNINGADISSLTSLSSWTMVRVFDSWRDKTIRPFKTFAIDYNHPGKVAFIGDAEWLQGDLGNMPVDEGAFVWESYDYGVHWNASNLHTDGPGGTLYQVNNPGFGHGSPDHLNVTITGWHNTAFYDSEGNLHWPFMQAYGYSNASGSVYYSEFLPQAEMVWDGTGFTFREVPELPGHDDLSGHSVPWVGTTTYPVVTFSNYPGASPIFQDNTEKQAYNAENHWIAQVWVDGTKEYLGDTLHDANYSAYIHHPVIQISVSPDNGRTWSEPIELTNIYSPFFNFARQITVYPFICDKIVDLGNNWGRLDMIYLNDSSWGSYCTPDQQGTNTGGDINFCSVKIHFPEVGAFVANAGGPYAALVGDDIQFLGGVTGGTEPYTWHWVFGDGHTADVRNPVHNYSTAGVKTVSLTVTDSLGAQAINSTIATITILQIPAIEIGAIKGSLLQVSAIIKSTGNCNATNIIWKITVKGGIFGLINVTANGTIPTLAPNVEKEEIAQKIFGLGKVNITVTAFADGLNVGPIKQATALVLGPFVLSVKEI